ncbi:unnamed protein product [Mytilus edulis]|uniref:Uncharacterized protein n=1 Tax=Mytilus edulis TaxID=6550 RepID=A0A8S3VDM2_MYTED|nr:unnamed protein product [Mytilus edulis]
MTFKGQFQFIIKNLYKSNAAIHLVIDPDDADRQKVNEHIELHLKSMGQYGKTKTILLPEKEKQRSHFKCEIKKTLQQSVNALGTTESLASRVERLIDTEGIHGIQAPDSNQKRKSNEIELTTFVIGLCDAILVNMGEGRIAEQKNALEIVVQSLLRIKLAGKKLNLKQICHFVLQEP